MFYLLVRLPNVAVFLLLSVLEDQNTLTSMGLIYKASEAFIFITVYRSTGRVNSVLKVGWEIDHMHSEAFIVALPGIQIPTLHEMCRGTLYRYWHF